MGAPLTPAQKAVRLALIRSVHARRLRESAAPVELYAGAVVSERDGFDDEGFEDPMTFEDDGGETL